MATELGKLPGCKTGSVTGTGTGCAPGHGSSWGPVKSLPALQSPPHQSPRAHPPLSGRACGCSSARARRGHLGPAPAHGPCPAAADANSCCLAAALCASH